MPVIRSAKKKLRADRKRESANKKLSSLAEISIKKAKRKPTPKSVQEAFSLVDKAVKKNVIHKNKAARLKSKLSKMLSKKTHVSAKSKTTIKTQAKKPKKNKK